MKRFFWIPSLLILIALIFLCTPLTNPADDPDNVWVDIVLTDTSGQELVQDNLTDSTGKPITITVRHYLPEFIDSANLSMVFPDGREELLVQTFWPGMDTSADTNRYSIRYDAETVCKVVVCNVILHRCGSYSIIANLKLKGSNDYGIHDTLLLTTECTPVRLTSLFGSLDLVTEPPFGDSDTARTFKSTVGSDKTGIDLLPQSDNPYAQTSINGVMFDKDSIAQWPLNVGTNDFTFITFADDTSVTDTLFLQIFRKASDDAALDSLDLSRVVLSPSFSPDDTAYTSRVRNEVSTISIRVSSRHPHAKMVLDDSLSLLSMVTSDSLNLDVGENVFAIMVTAENGSSHRRYTISIERMQDSTVVLQSILTDSCDTCLSFTPEQRSYEFYVENSMRQLNLTLRKFNTLQSLSIISEIVSDTLIASDDDSLVAKASFSLLSNRSNLLTLKVISESGYSGEYQFRVFRKPGTIATLDSIIPSVGNLLPDFTRDNLRYTVLIPSTKNAVSFLAVPTNEGASLVFSDINGKTGGNNFERSNLVSGENSGCFIAVTPENRDSIANGKNYVIDKIIRAYPVIIINEGNGDTITSDSSDIYHGIPRTIDAVAKIGYKFREWKLVAGNATIQSSSAPVCTVTALSACSLQAVFVPRYYTIVKKPVPYGTFTAPDSVRHATPCSLFAQPQAGYRFVNWRSDSSGVTFSDTTSPISTMTCTENDISLEAVFDLLAYRLIVESDGNGIIINAEDQMIRYGDTTLIAVQPKAGYHFSHWSILDGYVKIADSTRSGTSILMDSTNARIKAICELNTYAVQHLSQNGHIDGEDTVLHGKSYQVTAVPDAGYVFDRWVPSGDNITIDSLQNISARLMVNGENARLEALFKLDTYQLSITNNDSGSIEGAGNVLHKERRTITAVPATGFHFVTWKITSGSASIEETLSAVTVAILTEGSAGIEAVFDRNDYFLSIESEANGTAGSSGIVKHGVPYSITASADPHFHFINWSLQDGNADISETFSASATAKVLEDSTVLRAFFAIDTHTLTLSTIEGGTVSGAGNRSYGSTDSIHAYPASGYHFTGWTTTSQDVEIADLSQESTVLKLLANASVTATFALNEYTTSLLQTVHGSISLTNGDTGSVMFIHGVAQTIKAVPESDSGYHFVKWEPVGSVSLADTFAATTEMFVTGDSASVKALFEINRYKWKVIKTGRGTGTITCTRANNQVVEVDDFVTHGEQIAILAQPAVGCSLATWITYGDIFLPSPTSAQTFAKVYADTCQLIADFALKRYTLTIDTLPNAGCSTVTQPANPVLHGIDTSISVTPKTGYRFVNWKKTVKPDSIIFTGSIDSQMTTVKLTGNATIQPVFEKIPFPFTIDKEGDGADSGIVACTPGIVDGIVRFGDILTLTATPKAGAVFTGWEASAGVSYLPNYDATKNPVQITIVNQDTSLKSFSVTGKFELKTYSMGYAVKNAVDGSSSGGYIVPKYKVTPVKHGVPMPVKATPGTGFKIKEWQATGEVRIILPDPAKPDSIIFIVTGPGTLQPNTVIAVFTPLTFNLKLQQPPAGVGLITKPVQDMVVEINKETPIQAIMGTGYTFDNWLIVSGSGASFKGSYKNISDAISLSNGDITLAIAYHENEYTLTIGNSNPDKGAVSPMGDVKVKHFTPQVVSIAPNPGFSFSGWTDTLNSGVKITQTTPESHLFTLIKQTVATANFTPIPYPFTVKVASQGDTRTADEVVPHTWNQEVTITAQPITGWHFVNWTNLSAGTLEFVNATSLSTSPATILQKDFPVTVQPVFAINSYEFSMVVEDPAMGTISPAPATMNHGLPVSFTASPIHPYRFVKWKKLSNADSITIVDSTAQSTAISIINKASVKAVFELKTYTVVVNANDVLRGTVTPAINGLVHGVPVTLTATNNPTFKFIQWNITSSGVVDIDNPLSPTAIFTFAPDVDIHDTKITAIFDAE